MNLFDANGNLMRSESSDGKVVTRNYNGFNWQTDYVSADVSLWFRYLPNGLRYSKQKRTDSTCTVTTHHWDGSDIVMDVSQNGTVKGRYLRGNGKLIAEDIAGSLSYYFFNAHGDVINRVNGSNGAVLKTYNYDSFGNIINPPTVGDPNDPLYVDQSPFGYAGEYLDKENGEIYLRARYYNSEYGRFVTEDPAKYGTNWYSYCENNPVTQIDRTGLIATTDGSEGSFEDALDHMNDTYGEQQDSLHPELGPQPQLEKPKSSGSSEGASASKEETTVAMPMNLMFNSSILNFAWFMSKRNNNIIFDNIQPTITNIFNTVAEDTVVESVARAISHGYVVSNLIPAFSGAKVLGGVDVVAKSNYILKNANTIVKTAPIVSVALDYTTQRINGENIQDAFNKTLLHIAGGVLAGIIAVSLVSSPVGVFLLTSALSWGINTIIDNIYNSVVQRGVT